MLLKHINILLLDDKLCLSPTRVHRKDASRNYKTKQEANFVEMNSLQNKTKKKLVYSDAARIFCKIEHF